MQNQANFIECQFTADGASSVYSMEFHGGTSLTSMEVSSVYSMELHGGTSLYLHGGQLRVLYGAPWKYITLPPWRSAPCILWSSMEVHQFSSMEISSVYSVELHGGTSLISMELSFEPPWMSYLHLHEFLFYSFMDEISEIHCFLYFSYFLFNLKTINLFVLVILAKI